jgi:LPS-assembly lipoprotein
VWSIWSSYKARILAGRWAVAVLLLAVAACGFRPLYGEGPRQAAIADLGAIEVAPIADRIGQLTHNLLLDNINPRGRPSDPAYRLQVGLRETRTRLGFQKDATATRARMDLVARFDLVELASGAVVSSGNSRATASYNIVESDFATLATEKNARERVARIVADDITIRVAACFSRRETCFKRPTAAAQ